MYFLMAGLDALAKKLNQTNDYVAFTYTIKTRLQPQTIVFGAGAKS